MHENLFSLEGKNALVTGGAKGLGRMIAEALLSAGASVTITSRKADAVHEAANEMSSIGPCTGIACDLSAPEGAEQLHAAYLDKNDGLDILVNNAGKTWGGPIESFPDKAWAGIMAVNVQVPFKLVQLFLPELTCGREQSDPARVINIGSVAGMKVEPINAYSYISSKAAIHQLSRQLAAELADRNVTVNAIVPGFFQTSMTAHLQDAKGNANEQMVEHIPMQRFGVAADIAGVIILLTSRAGAYITGTNIPVDGGVSGCS